MLQGIGDLHLGARRGRVQVNVDLSRTHRSSRPRSNLDCRLRDHGREHDRRRGNRGPQAVVAGGAQSRGPFAQLHCVGPVENNVVEIDRQIRVQGTQARHHGRRRLSEADEGQPCRASHLRVRH